jgi:hypothetical protein
MGTSLAWIVVADDLDLGEAEIISALLKSFEIESRLSNEGGTAIGLPLVPMSNVDVLVRESDFEKAETIVDGYYSGAYEEDDLEDERE